MFCTLTYANSKGLQWLGSHFRLSVGPGSSSAVKWERRSAVWKWISLAEIRGALSEPCNAFNGEKRTAVQIVFGTLSTCYFVTQMENNNTDSGLEPALHGGMWEVWPAQRPLRLPHFLLDMQSDFLEEFWLKEFNRLTNIAYDDKWQSAKWAVTRLLREIIRNIHVNKNKIKRLSVPTQQTGQGFFN